MDATTARRIVENVVATFPDVTIEPTAALAAELLARLEQLGRVELIKGRLIVDVPPGVLSPALATLVRTHRDLIAWTIIARRGYLVRKHADDEGRRVHHEWAPCDVCGQAILVRTDKHPRCRLTPDCAGRHRVRRRTGPSRARGRGAMGRRNEGPPDEHPSPPSCACVRVWSFGCALKVSFDEF